MPSALIVIPARMQASRLPGKPMADIAGEPMIVHVWRRAMAADVGQVIVATDARDVFDAVTAAGGKAVMTRVDHASGSDRVFEAVETVDPERRVDIVVNLQGDLPTLEPHLVTDCMRPLEQSEVDIATLAAVITDEQERSNPNVVKVVGAQLTNGMEPAAHEANNVANAPSSVILRALYFTRATAPFGDGPLYHHIGIYAYRRTALHRFVKLPPSPLETRERLEQLRALENGMRIDVAVVDTVPLGVDTPADLERARQVIGTS